MIYLDYAAATPLDGKVGEAMRPFLAERFYNPSANYAAAKEVKQTLEQARATIARWFGARASDIVFTAGGTEANNLAITGVMRQFPGANLVVSGIEHEAVLAPARLFNCSVALTTGKGIVNITDLATRINDKTVLVSVMYANNEIGTLQPLRDISHTIQSIRLERQRAGNTLPLYFHTDAAQAANYLDLHVARLGVDLMTINGGKIYGPKQSGALYVSSKVQLEPLIHGGGQERNLRSGTENVAACVGLAKALDLVQEKRHQESKRLASLQQLTYKLIAQKLPGAIINGSIKNRLPNNVHLTLPGHDNE